MASDEIILEPLNKDQLKAIAFVEHYWFKFDGHFPSREAFFNRMPDFDINAALNHKTFRIALINRGIDPPVGPLDDALLNVPQGITKEQLAAIVTVVNFEDKRTRATKFKELGVTPQKWQGWLKIPTFKQFLQELSAANLQDAMYVANEALIKAMDRGDTNAIKFYMEITGKYQAATPQTQNIRLVLARVVEAIQRHVKDPETLRLIGEDFEAILNGTTEEARQVTSSRAPNKSNSGIDDIEAEIAAVS
jgi:hypothetical protein